MRLEDLGDKVVVTPLADDPITAARGALKGMFDPDALRKQARDDDEAAQARR